MFGYLISPVQFSCDKMEDTKYECRVCYDHLVISLRGNKTCCRALVLKYIAENFMTISASITFFRLKKRVDCKKY